MLAQAERAVEAVRRAARGEQWRAARRVPLLRRELPDAAGRAHVPRAPPRRSRSRPRTWRSRALVAGLREGSLDAGLSRPPLVDDLATEIVLREPVAAVLPTGIRWRGARELTLADLAAEPWVLTPRASWPPWHRKYDEDFAARGLPRRASCSAGRRRRTCSRSSPPASASRGCRCRAQPARRRRHVRAARRRGRTRSSSSGARTRRIRRCRGCARSSARSRPGSSRCRSSPPARSPPRAARA